MMKPKKREKTTIMIGGIIYKMVNKMNDIKLNKLKEEQKKLIDKHHTLFPKYTDFVELL